MVVIIADREGKFNCFLSQGKIRAADFQQGSGCCSF